MLAASVTPKERSYSHSGAGRIGRVRLRTMSLFESGDSNGAVSLSGLLDGKGIDPGSSSLSQDRLIELMVRGGWPANVGVAKDDAGVLPEQYIMALAETDISSVDNIRRNPALVLHLLAAIARTNVTPALLNVIVADVGARFGEVARQTVAEYISALKRLYFVEEIPQWFPELRDRQRLRRTPKRMLADPSIAISALNARPGDLTRDPRTLGGVFENLCLRDLMVYSEAIGAKLCHYHDANGLEVDAILDLGTKWAGIEIKMGAHRVPDGVASLMRLRDKLVSKGASTPEFLCVITGGGPYHTRDDGVHVIPIDCLGP